MLHSNIIKYMEIQDSLDLLLDPLLDLFYMV
jgi:hypothetical protein